jgi:tRNA threonylcarbamoyladenosine biosynthesis protein TsaE
MNWFIPTPEDWNVVAQEIAAKFKDGNILTLAGPLGAGKTTFVQALALALGAERSPKSPTFSMLRTYPISANGLSRLLHVDAYRIENEVDLVPLDLDDELGIPGTILVIEWPENIPGWLETRKHLALTIEMEEEGRKAELK